MSHLESSITSVTSITCGYAKRLFTRLLYPAEVPGSKKPLPIDKIEPSVYKEPRISYLSSNQLTRCLQRKSPSKTTYAKPHYFAHIKPIEKSLPYLIKERLPDETLPVDSPKLLFGAKFNLNQSGILKQTPDGLVYLQISDEYIHKLYPFFYPQGAEKPPYSAHIAVMSEEESSSIGDMKELGDHFTFSVKECKRIIPKHVPDTEAIWVLSVESPSLMSLREHYRLPSKLHSQDFNIVLAIKYKKTVSVAEEHECHYFRINPAVSCV